MKKIPIKTGCLFIILYTIIPNVVFAQSPFNIHQIIDEGGGIWGVITGIEAILFLYLLGYPILFVINVFRLHKSQGYAAAKKRCFKVTKQSIEELISIGLLLVFIIIPISLIPLVIAISIMSLILSFIIGIPYGKYSVEIMIIYCCAALIIGLIYTLYRAVRETKI